MENLHSDDEGEAADDRECDYKPQVVVLRAGDLTEEEADREKQRLLRGSFRSADSSIYRWKSVG